VIADALDPRTVDEVARRAHDAGVALTRDPPHLALSGVHVAVVASGTATLECAALGVPPVIVYRTDALTYSLARRLVRVPHIGLPNLVLGRRAFVELLQREVHGPAIATAIDAELARRGESNAACQEVRARLAAGLDGRAAGARVADMVRPWLS
jgi:lipid-A-disaccharide synthase